MTMRVVFMGTPEFAVPSLAEILSNGYNVVAVYTQPPRPAGRGQRLVKSPIHQFAEIMGLEVRTPERFRKSRVIDEFAELKADVACVVAYGQILPSRALSAPEMGCLNLHASLLPRWRGAAPVQRAIMVGDEITGVQIMQMDAGLDTGDILLSETVDIRPDETAGQLSDRLSRIGAGLWPRALAALSRGGLAPTPQTGEPTYAHKIEKREARLDWARTAHELDCHIRGLSPQPGAWCELDGKRLKVYLARPEAKPLADIAALPGTALDDNLLIACGDGALRLTDVQMQGKPKMSAQDFLHGHSVLKGTLLS